MCAFRKPSQTRGYDNIVGIGTMRVGWIVVG
jgi:hypothetical protein